MKRIKGRYVAQINIELDADALIPGLLPFDEIKENWKNINEIIKETTCDEVGDDERTKVEVTETYNDIEEVEE